MYSVVYLKEAAKTIFIGYCLDKNMPMFTQE